MPDVSRWAAMSWPEVQEAARSGAVAVWPVGATEQHGAHLASGFDIAAATAVCERAAVLAPGRAVLLPGLALGASRHWLPLGGTLALSARTVGRIALEIASSVGSAGFRTLVIVNGHGGNVSPMLAGLDELGPGDPEVELVSYWTLVDPDELEAACEADRGRIGHAGEIETSVALYLGGGLAIEGRVPAEPGRPLSDGNPFLQAPNPLRDAPSGVYGDPSTARAELGRLVIEEAAAGLARRLADSGATRPRSAAVRSG